MSKVVRIFKFIHVVVFVLLQPVDESTSIDQNWLYLQKKLFIPTNQWFHHFQSEKILN